MQILLAQCKAFYMYNATNSICTMQVILYAHYKIVHTGKVNK